VQAAISIDIGGTSTTVAMVEEKGDIVQSINFPMHQFSNETNYFKSVFAAVEELLLTFQKSNHISGIGIGAPSCVAKTGTINGAANLPFQKEVPIVSILKKQFNLPAYLIKDGNAAALGEGLYGGAKGMENYMVLTLGTGLGCGIVINSKVVAGHTGQAGELGHASIKLGGRDCGCGAKGCLETYVSATGIKRTLQKLLSHSIANSQLRDISFNDLTPKMISVAAQDGDKIAKKAFEYTGQILGRKLAELAALFNPEAFFLAGGLADAGKMLFQPVNKYMIQNQLPLHKGNVKVLPSLLKTNEAALLGSASLVWQSTKLSKSCQQQR
jgi:glucokinase